MRAHNGATFEYCSLLRTARTPKGPRHELVAPISTRRASLGRHDEGLASDQFGMGWEQIGELLEGRAPAPSPGDLGNPLSAPARQWAQVDVRGLRVERMRAFGQVYLRLLQRLGLALPHAPKVVQNLLPKNHPSKHRPFFEKRVLGRHN